MIKSHYVQTIYDDDVPLSQVVLHILERPSPYAVMLCTTVLMLVVLIQTVYAHLHKKRINAECRYEKLSINPSVDAHGLCTAAQIGKDDQVVSHSRLCAAAAQVNTVFLLRVEWVDKKPDGEAYMIPLAHCDQDEGSLYRHG